jgi:uncharacterized protein YjbI with pentapeptide repeats
MLEPGEATIVELQAAYDRGQREFTDIDFSDVDASEPRTATDLVLDGASFERCWFHSVHFRRVSLRGVRFDRCNLKCATFEGCDLSESHWSECAVCSVGFAETKTDHLQAQSLHAYGATLPGAPDFLEYATNGRGGIP